MSSRKKSWVKSVFSQIPSKPTHSNEITISNNVMENESETHRSIIDNGSKKRNNLSLRTSNTSNWINNFAPVCAEDLAIHPKKILELQNWIQQNNKIEKPKSTQICLLTGPTGCGKTTAIRVLAKENFFNIQEWINPVDHEIYSDQFDDNKSYIGSQLEAFKDFLIRASRYKSLTGQCNKRLLLVEDFPNVLISNADSFQVILEQYLNYGISPLVFIVTDSKSRSLNISYNLFPDDIKTKFRIHHISFNPVATTFMQRAMKKFCSIMKEEEHYADKYVIPGQPVIDSIIVSAQGDIRNALINLYFSSLKGAPNIQTQRVLTNQKNKKQKLMLKSVGCDESITMLHALGRVFNPKFTDEHKFLHSPEEIAECFSSEPKKFIDFVHSNYLCHFREIEHLVTASNGLSLADVILSEYRDISLAQIALNIGVRSVMTSNATPVNGWMPIRGPKKLNISSLQLQREENQMLGSIKYVSNSLYATDYNTFLKLFKTKT